MAILTPSKMHKAAATVFAVTIPGHLNMGYQVVFPTLNKLELHTSEEALGKTGAVLCWNATATFLAVLAILHYRWSQTSGPRTMEEKAILVVTTVHIMMNAVIFLNVGQVLGGSALLTATSIGLAAYVLPASSSR